MGKAPNVILINCDDLGYGDLGCYGSRLNRTPAIDRLANEGLRLTDFYMASPVCSPSRGGMLTGCYPPRIGFGDFDGQWVLFPGQGVGLNPEEMTIAKVYQAAGYHTKLVGKWHCGDQPDFLPLRHGFDEYYGLPYSNDMGRQQGGNLDYPPLPLLSGDRVVQQQPDQRSLTERYVEQATEFIHRNRNEPFFLYFAHMHVHLPLYAPAAFTARSQNGDYGACVECIDWATRCIMHQLADDGLSENALVIFTSDNGSRGDNGGSNMPLRGTKGTTWEGGQRVPCIMWWPGHIEAGHVSDEIVSSIDFLPTLAGICGIDPALPSPIDGIDLSGLVLGAPGACGRDTFFYYLQNDLEAVRLGDWKLHVHKRGQTVNLLYNLKEDPSETTDLLASQPELTARMEALLTQCRTALGDSAQGITGRDVRSKGRVEHPVPLTVYDENHPYIMAMYDREDIG